jgi:iron complex outermembrane receptor protein
MIERPYTKRHASNLACAIRLLLGAATTTVLCATSAVADDTSASPDSGLEQIIVTAERRTEDVQKVPITVTAYTQEQMDDLGIRDMDDIARLILLSHV